ncbi:zeta toxin family protein, partial [Salmonella enterica]|uniref:zeta toxin family protein n=1 Tax=Salmonella enterica TaxID=28901 RepID=UPI0032970D8A
ARQQRFHVIVENTFAQPEVISQEAKRFQDAGYQTNFIALAVPDAASRLGIVTRYIKAHETAEYPRWTSEATHSNA